MSGVGAAFVVMTILFAVGIGGFIILAKKLDALECWKESHSHFFAQNLKSELDSECSTLQQKLDALTDSLGLEITKTNPQPAEWIVKPVEEDENQ